MISPSFTITASKEPPFPEVTFSRDNLIASLLFYFFHTTNLKID
jgi:hypothetical protein